MVGFHTFFLIRFTLSLLLYSIYIHTIMFMYAENVLVTSEVEVDVCIRKCIFQRLLLAACASE